LRRAGSYATMATCTAATLAASLQAQLLRGTVRMQGTDRVVAGVRISAMDSLGLTLLEVVSDERGRFTLALNADRPFRIAARKLGLQPAFSDFLHPARTDTLEVDLPIPADATVLPAVEVAGAKSPNQRAYEDAVRHGWKVYPPGKVAERRDRYRDFTDLLRGLQVSGVRFGKPGECVQSMRFMNRCLAIIIDDQPAGAFAQVVPTDVYFFAVLTATESAVRWGDRAPWGAIVIYTRMNGDRERP
jgi:hypothetical protein